MFGFGNYGKTSQYDVPDAPKGFADFDRAIIGGLPDCEVDRLREASQCVRYADGYFDDQTAIRSGSGRSNVAYAQSGKSFNSTNLGYNSRYEKSEYVLNQPVMKRMVEKLCEHLYKRSPTRELADKAVGDVLNAAYKRNAMAAKWQRANEFTAIGGFAAFQFAGTDDPSNPVKIHLWGPDQLIVWTDDDDPTVIVAVATVDRIDGRTRCRLWTADFVREYWTKRGHDIGDTTRKFDPIGPAKPNPYRLPTGEGIIPFAFAHWQFPALEFTYQSPGPALRDLNSYVNFGFDDLADGVRYLTKPIGVATGVSVEWDAPATIRPGMFLRMPAGQVDLGGSGPQPGLDFLTPDNQFVTSTWLHLNSWLDLSMEMHGIPPSTVRMMLAERSGVSILAEQAPLLGWTEKRRRSFDGYEERAVSVFCAVAGSHLAANGYANEAAPYFAASLAPGLSMVWPRLYTDLPGPERDRADALRVGMGTASIIDLVEEREDLTREQAIEKLKAVQVDNQDLLALGINPFPDAFKALLRIGTAPIATTGNPAPNSGISTPEPMQNPVAGMNGDPNRTSDDLSQEGG